MNIVKIIVKRCCRFFDIEQLILRIRFATQKFDIQTFVGKLKIIILNKFINKI